MNKIQFHAFYSQNMANWCGTYIYRDANGNPVEVTATARSKAFGERYIQWANLKYLGEVTTPAERCKEPIYGNS